ncbi:sorting nexin-13-like isoform X2 [Anopheles stephensi]|uniref:sorting nexin-13-like isoform X2 n=1 Tax=Anopheles stephensi TaxID=30069 RepID=UPI001658A733|nr:sorting nexin-13-like isoform X2 [Anopheles stephensi]
MEFKYASWIALSVAVSINLFGVFWVTTMVIGLVLFLLGFLTILYLQHSDLDKFLDSGLLENPLDEPKSLGLSIVCDPKPGNLLLISPNIKVQTESNRNAKAHNQHHPPGAGDSSATGGAGNRRRNFLDAGIELLFKKREPRTGASEPPAKSNTITDHLMHRGHHLHFHQRDHHTILDNSPEGGPAHPMATQPPPNRPSPGEERTRWRPFESIKIHTDKRAAGADHEPDKHRSKKDGNVSIGEEVSVASTPLSSFKSYLTHPTDILLHHQHRQDTPPGSPRKKKILSGNKPIDKLIHTILDYVVRDFIDSWYTVVSDNRDFSECSIRTSIETLILQICQRVRSVDLLPLMTTRLIDDLAKHTRFYRLATQEVATGANSKKSSTGTDPKRSKLHEKLSPQRRNLKVEGHRRNKSETDLTWQLGNAALQKNVANSRFYSVPADEQSSVDPETMLLHSFFGFCEEYRSECMDPEALNEYLRQVSETVLYFVLPEEDFNCLTLRTLLCNLLANSLLKPMLNTLADPDFINLQIAKQFTKDPPAGEFLLKMIRQSTDLSELRACRQLITKEMDAKYKDSSCSAELASLKYTQKLIDLRISHLQNNKNDFGKTERDKASTNLPQLSLDDILRKELAVFYYLDYLSVLNLQKYVIFYLTAQEWKISTSQCFSEMQVNKSKLSREELLRSIREKASTLYQEYLQPSSPNYLNIDPGLIEALNFRLNDPSIQPENTWFDSICKYIYEKQKNEEVFLNNFYQSVAYKQLLRELDFHSAHDPDLPSLEHLTVFGGLGLQGDSASDTNSGDIRFDETDDDEDAASLTAPTLHGPPITVDIREEHDVRAGLPVLKKPSPSSLFPTTVSTIKHARSHSDCTGMFAAINDLNIEQLRQSSDCSSNDSGNEAPTAVLPTSRRIPAPQLHADEASFQGHTGHHQHHHHQQYKHKLSARIINTAIHCEGHYAVYAIQVHVIEDNHHKSWHIYRRYSKFLELKKLLVKRFPALERVPFPAKKTFQNTQRAVLEHRMEILNRFLAEVCAKAELSEEMMAIIRNFLEPDTDDRKMHGGPVVKTIESLKSGMSKIRNMPDTLVGGISRMFVSKSSLKERSFYDIQDIPTLELKQSEYPALASALNLLDEVFDLQNKSQWLRRGLINRLLGAPWVSHATNKRIIQTASSLLAPDKLEAVLSSILNNVWPEGDRFNPTTPLREDSTRLRTKLAAKISLFALLSDDLKHVVGSVTCNSGLLSFFQMLQNRKLNTRLLLILFNRLLVVILQTENITKHALLSGGPGGTNAGERTNGADDTATATIRIGTPALVCSGSRKASRYS